MDVCIYTHDDHRYKTPKVDGCEHTTTVAVIIVQYYMLGIHIFTLYIVHVGVAGVDGLPSFTNTGKMARTHGHRTNSIPVVEAVPIRTETVRKRTEAVRKWCKHSVRLQQAESVLCPCVRAIFPVQMSHLDQFLLPRCPIMTGWLVAIASDNKIKVKEIGICIRMFIRNKNRDRKRGRLFISLGNSVYVEVG